MPTRNKFLVVIFCCCLLSASTKSLLQDKTLYPVSVGGMWGFINSLGELVIESQYNDAGNFKHGLARVLLGTQWGYINLSGEQVIKPKYTQASDFLSSGIAEVSIGRVQVLIDKKGALIGTRGRVLAPEGFSEGLIRDRKANRWGFKNQTGATIVKYIYEWVSPFNEGRAVVKKNGKYGFIDRSGREINIRYEYAKEFSEGFAAVVLGNKLGFVDKSGAIVISPQFDAVEGVGFVNGYTIVRVRGKVGFVNKSGNLVIPPQYARAKFFGSGLAPVLVGDKVLGQWGYVDEKGMLVIDAQFDEAHSFFGELAFVRQGGISGYINTKGKFVWKNE